jgi:Arc/MetJ-type ribon-helix-helix transcriptional regulator
MSNEKDEKKYISVSLPAPLADKIQKRIEGTEFDSISSYVTYVLTELLSELEEENDYDFSKEDEQRVKDRLRALGYLD